MTTLTYFGHASFLFETNEAAILTDPWFSPKGAFLGTWRQLPPNDHVVGTLIEKMKMKPTLIFLTHEHEDHYDEETLQKLLPYAKGVCIPKYENEFLKNLISKNLGVTAWLVEENNPQNFHGIHFNIFIDESGINRDSAIFMKAEGFSFFDGNDCKIFDRAQWLHEICGQIDVLSSQFSGANMHPICYEMPYEEYRKVSKQKKLRKFVAVRNFFKDMKPRYYIPSAGPAVFPFVEHHHLNFEQETIFPKWWEFRDYLLEKKDGIEFVPLNVGGTINVDSAGKIAITGIADEIPNEELEAIIQYYRAVDAKTPDKPILGDDAVLEFFVNEMDAKIKVLRDNPGVKLSSPVYFRISRPDSSKIQFRLDPETLLLEKNYELELTPPYYLHSTTTAALGKLIFSGKGWGTYFLSFMFRGQRDPDVFDTVLGTFFVANDAADLDFGLKKLVQFKESDEYVTLTAANGNSVTCRRFCPHQGADLKYASFDGRYVTCPRHQWKFDCENGGKADNSSDTIDATLEKT